MTAWLTAEQQTHWRAFLSVIALLPDEFSRDIQCSHGVSMADYEILVRLSESPDRCMRMSDLAARTLASRSRLTHQIDRMARDGYVERRPCSDDKRGYLAVMTDAGWDKLVETAPSHVASVREHLVDILTAEEFALLGELSNKILASLTSENKLKRLDLPCTNETGKEIND
jgi:DNA-binding MarR family transcriptional regulator